MTFNPTIVRFKLVAHIVIIPSLIVFQSYYSSIQTQVVDSKTKLYKYTFNPTIVRFKLKWLILKLNYTNTLSILL